MTMTETDEDMTKIYEKTPVKYKQLKTIESYANEPEFKKLKEIKEFKQTGFS